MFFRRRRGRHAASADRPPTVDTDRDADVEGAAPADGGPYDADDAPDDDIARVDLGSLRVPVRATLQAQLLGESAERLTRVVLTDGRSGLELSAMAAPRTEGIWDELREQMSADLARDGASPREVDGEFGVELWARVTTPEGQQDVRFLGIDGPRWMLRAVYSGAAGADVAAGADLDEALRGVVVVRGDAPMPVREPLVLSVPTQTRQESAPEPAAGLAAPRRGVETTETR